LSNPNRMRAPWAAAAVTIALAAAASVPSAGASAAERAPVPDSPYKTVLTDAHAAITKQLSTVAGSPTAPK
jgi:hypothetical protein